MIQPMAKSQLHAPSSPNPAMLWLHLRSIIRTAGLLLTGRFHSIQDHYGKLITAEDGHAYAVFREIAVDPGKSQPAVARAVFTIRFRVEKLSPRQNKLFSLLPIALYAGMPGFRTKIFTIDGCDCRSIYTWDTVADAERYSRSYAIRFMAARSVQGSVFWTIQPVEAACA